MTTENNNGESDATSLPTVAEVKPICGIVMPISALDGCTEHHWSEVKSLISDAVGAVGFASSLVSDADDVGIIQKRIIQNLYENPIVVCDVSGKNPNVMFELGMRLAFDKPTVIIKDDRTSYSFDTSPIEHLEYPRDLRYGRIVEFKAILGEKVRGTYDRSQKDANYTTFLKHFGQFSVANLETKQVSSDQFIIEQIAELRDLVLSSRREAASTDTVDRKKMANAIVRMKTETAFNELVAKKGRLTFPDDENAIVDRVAGELSLDNASPKVISIYKAMSRQYLRELLDRQTTPHLF
jgi:hypothetical protein